MRLTKGDLVACYVTNSEEYESLMQWGIVLDVNPAVQDVLVLDNQGYSRWWPERRWRILEDAKEEKPTSEDSDIKPV